MSFSSRALLTVASYVDVHRLVAVEAIEKLPVRARKTRDSRHVAFALGMIISGSGAICQARRTCIRQRAAKP
jgi:hypothetical protein